MFNFGYNSNNPMAQKRAWGEIETFQIIVIYDQRLACSQVWFPTVQDVLQADWQDVWHSPHPPVLTVSLRFFVVIVLMRSIVSSILKCDKNVPRLFVCAQKLADKLCLSTN